MLLGMLADAQASFTNFEWTILAPLLGVSLVVASIITVLVRKTSPLDSDFGGKAVPKLQYAVSKPSKKKEEVHYPNGRMDVWFGSQTGTAETFAKTLAKDAMKHGE